MARDQARPPGQDAVMSRRHLVVGLRMAPLGNLGNIPQQALLRIHLNATLFILGGNRQYSSCFPWLVLQALFFLPGSHQNHMEMLKFSHAQTHPELCGPDLFRLCKVTLTCSPLLALQTSCRHIASSWSPLTAPVLPCAPVTRTPDRCRGPERMASALAPPPPCSWDPDSGIIVGHVVGTRPSL